MEFFYTNASIECANAQIITRKIVPSSFSNIKNVGRCSIYSCSRDSSAEIQKELDPKQPRNRALSHLDHGDMIKAKDIIVYVNDLKRLNCDVQHHSHTHKAHEATTKYYTFAQITQPFPNLLPLKNPKQIPPTPLKLYPTK